jgi:photosystem II stability/assembly factor-like uncharacterized protein
LRRGFSPSRRGRKNLETRNFKPETAPAIPKLTNPRNSQKLLLPFKKQPFPGKCNSLPFEKTYLPLHHKIPFGMLNDKFIAILLLVILLGFFVPSSSAQQSAVEGLSLRAIGPAVMGGRISDIAVHPADPSTWYVAAGSGNLWKTTNRGITWQAVFDKQASYSIGCVTIDPQQPEVVWVGTGENVSGRHVGWGDGVYCSRNGGKSWKNMGLTHSEHIGKILVDPRDSDVILVAAEGPLWASGGERGVYRSRDGGKSWEQVLSIDEHTGVTDLEFDPSNPDIVYAAAYQRRRHTWALLAGGPGSGIYKSTDNGSSWRKLSKGLPQGDIGKIGLAVTPAKSLPWSMPPLKPMIEEKGLYRSLDRGRKLGKAQQLHLRRHRAALLPGNRGFSPKPGPPLPGRRLFARLPRWGKAV